MRFSQKIIALLLAVLLMATALVPAFADGGATATLDWGVAYIERRGLGFSVDGEMKLRGKDILETKVSSQLTARFGETSVVMSENSSMCVLNAENVAIEVQDGEAFVNVPAGQQAEFTFSGKTFAAENCAFTLDVRTGSETVNLLKGEISIDGQNVKAGETLSYSGDSASVFSLDLASLNDFFLNQASALAKEDTLFASADAFDSVVQARADERAAMLAEKLERERKLLEQGGSEQNIEGVPGGDSGLSCTIQIRCDTILDNMENLEPGKNAYVPANGVILATSTIGFVDGETVFDVLKRACEAAEIQLEYSWTPMYDSYYIEGINNLYEFDCGNESGWMYKVNGWFPNYGCSAYPLKDGDVIVWCYTCNGLGADVGGGMQ